MASITANIGGGVSVTGTLVQGQGVQYVITLANGSTAGPYTGDQLVNVGSGLRSFPPPEEFRLTYNGQTIATSNNPGDINSGPNIVPNLFGIQNYIEKNLANDPNQTPDVAQPAAEPTTPAETDTIIDDGSDPYVDTATGESTIAPQVDNVDPYVDLVEGTATVAPQDIIDDGSDPYVSNGVSTIPLPQPQEVIDDGSDPYVSNGVSTIPVPEPQRDVEENVFNPGTTTNAGDENIFNPNVPDGTNVKGTSVALNDTRSEPSKQDSNNAGGQKDWRVRLQLAPNANYLYRHPSGDVGILEPLIETDGILFPYTPSISVNYSASYDATDLTHSNYKIFQYKSSAVDSVSISCDFTAQDVFEANYLLAVIHFLRSVTKMFYGQDQNPVNGTPPPLCYLNGLGTYQFDEHPLVITSFNYTLPTDVDYIQAGAYAAVPGIEQPVTGKNAVPRQGSTIGPGGTNPGPSWRTSRSSVKEPTYVPTKMQISIGALPIVSRNDISNRFSLDIYSTGWLLRGSKNRGAGIW